MHTEGLTMKEIVLPVVLSLLLSALGVKAVAKTQADVKKVRAGVAVSLGR